jgi:hypothetical protein
MSNSQIENRQASPVPSTPLFGRKINLRPTRLDRLPRINGDTRRRRRRLAKKLAKKDEIRFMGAIEYARRRLGAHVETEFLRACLAQRNWPGVIESNPNHFVVDSAAYNLHDALARAVRRSRETLTLIIPRNENRSHYQSPNTSATFGALDNDRSKLAKNAP